MVKGCAEESGRYDYLSECSLPGDGNYPEPYIPDDDASAAHPKCEVKCITCTAGTHDYDITFDDERLENCSEINGWGYLQVGGFAPIP